MTTACCSKPDIETKIKKSPAGFFNPLPQVPLASNTGVLQCGIPEHVKRQGFRRCYQHEDIPKVTLKKTFNEEPPVPSDPSGDINTKTPNTMVNKMGLVPSHESA